DGGENNEITYVDLKHYEVAPVFSRTQHVMIPDLVIAESAYLERMKPEDRELLTRILNDSVEDEFDLWNEQIEIAKEAAKEQGVTFVDVDIRPFQENCKKLHEEAVSGSSFAGELYDRIRALAR
ncbi:TRAP transporter substrate-binding protein, partial [Enterocloster hominis]